MNSLAEYMAAAKARNITPRLQEIDDQIESLIAANPSDPRIAQLQQEWASLERAEKSRQQQVAA